jgi:hypothetical protein
MEISIFTPSRPADDFNDLPEPSKRNGLFWAFTNGMLQSERVPESPEVVDPKIEKMRRYIAETERLNLPPTRGEVVAGIVGDVVDGVTTAVRKMPALKRATEFLARVLDVGQVSEKEVMRLAQLEGLSEKTVKRARSKMKVKSTKKGRGGWFLSMTRTEPKSDGGRNS